MNQQSAEKASTTNGSRPISMLIIDTPENPSAAFVTLLQERGLAVSAERIVARERLLEALRAGDRHVLLLNPVAGDFPVEDCARWVREQQADCLLALLVEGKPSTSALGLAWQGGVDVLVSLDAPDYSVAGLRRELEAQADRRRAALLRRANDELLERCHLLLKSSRDPIAYIHQGMHVFANDAYLEHFGFSDLDELTGVPFIDLVDDLDRGPLKAYLKAAQDKRGGKTPEQRHEPLPVRAHSTKGETFSAVLTFMTTQYEGENCLQVLVSIDDKATVEAPSADRPPAGVASPRLVETPGKTAVAQSPIERTIEERSAEERSAEESAAPVRKAFERALAEMGLTLSYPPVISVMDIETEYYDTEVRPRGAEFTACLSGDCRALAERLGLGQKLDRWIIGQALVVMAEHDNQGETLQFLINLCGQTVRDRQFPDWLNDQVARHKLDNRHLVLHVAQADLLAERDLFGERIKQLRELGFKTALAGYTPGEGRLELLRANGIRLIKLDASLLASIADKPNRATHLERIVSDLHKAGVRVIATRVDDNAILSALWKINVDLVQGEHLPLPGTARNLLMPSLTGKPAMA